MSETLFFDVWFSPTFATPGLISSIYGVVVMPLPKSLPTEPGDPAPTDAWSNRVCHRAGRETLPLPVPGPTEPVAEWPGRPCPYRRLVRPSLSPSGPGDPAPTDAWSDRVCHRAGRETLPLLTPGPTESVTERARRPCLYRRLVRTSLSPSGPGDPVPTDAWSDRAGRETLPLPTPGPTQPVTERPG